MGTTDGVAERVYHDVNMDSAYYMTETAVTAYFTQFSNTLYMSWDASCETGPEVEPCLQKGDLIFVTDANWGKSEQIVDKASWKKFFGGRDSVQYTSGYADTTDLYTITKIWKAEETSKTATFEDKYRITVDKSINWDGSEVADPDGDLVKNTGYVQILKFTPASTGAYTYSRSARTAASATATTPSASASRATPTTTATRSRRSRSKTTRAVCSH